MLLEDREAFLEWAEEAVGGLKTSAVMLALLDGEDTYARMEFALQIGHCILSEKPILVVAARGTRIPEKLRTVATVIVEYDPENFEAAQPALAAALRRCVPQ